jgi:nucleoporin POM34
MATPKTPSTPAAQLSASRTQPGTWIHPKFNEIARRKNASTFGEKHMHRIIYNIGGILVMFLGEKLLKA